MGWWPMKLSLSPYMVDRFLSFVFISPYGVWIDESILNECLYDYEIYITVYYYWEWEMKKGDFFLIIYIPILKQSDIFLALILTELEFFESYLENK